MDIPNKKPPAELGDDKKDATEEFKTKLERCEKERNEYLDGWKRAKADLSNYKKDEAKRLEEFLKFSTATLIQELITVLDSFDLGLAVVSDDDPAKKGMQLIRTQLEEVLKKFGLSRISVVVGKQFNPNLEEAVGEVAADVPDGSIVEEVGRGYMLHNKVIRPSRVIVAKGQH
ncbi:nucleotide exchange factor GrpE [Candidatus Jorgensenbacteria bacterium]|nr:nucleotide exchange factor GrpE [Candidatus Jorgensenbacteria bacterium]